MNNRTQITALVLTNSAILVVLAFLSSTAYFDADSLSRALALDKAERITVVKAACEAEFIALASQSENEEHGDR